MDTDSEERGKYNEKLHSGAAKRGRWDWTKGQDGQEPSAHFHWRPSSNIMSDERAMSAGVENTQDLF
jgi:hypothetical protein